MNNTKAITIGPQTQSGYADPFTGTLYIYYPRSLVSLIK